MLLLNNPVTIVEKYKTFRMSVIDNYFHIMIYAYASYMVLYFSSCTFLFFVEILVIVSSRYLTSLYISIIVLHRIANVFYH